MLWQSGDIGFVEAALDEPVRGARGEHEQFLQCLGLGDADHVVEDGLAVAAVAALRVHREAGQFGGGLVGERVQRGAADDAVVVFQHHIIGVSITIVFQKPTFYTHQK